MKHWWAALFLVLALSPLAPAQAQGGGAAPRVRPPSGGGLGQNYPNPFNPETFIPFTVGDAPTCSEPGRLHRVTLRVYNLLAQLVAVPVLQGASAGGEGGRPIVNLMLPCGAYTAYWDGKQVGTSREVASGVYLYRLEVDGKAMVKKMMVTK